MIDVPLTPDLVRGALELERTVHGLLPHRLPARARAQFPDAYLAAVEAQPSGVRLAFRTRATAVELDVLPVKVVHPGLPEPEDGRALYGEADHAELPLPDELHPDAAGHRRIGERFAAEAFGSHGPFTADGSR